MDINNKPSFVFTPGQRAEALLWIKQECPQLYAHIEEALTGHEADMLIDMFFKLKSSTFELLPNEFIVGVEYKSKEDIIAGKEAINIRLPHAVFRRKAFALDGVVFLRAARLRNDVDACILCGNAELRFANFLCPIREQPHIAIKIRVARFKAEASSDQFLEISAFLTLGLRR